MAVYNICWGEHKSSMSSFVQSLYHEDDFVDVTLAACDGDEIKAHKVVLSSGSTVLKKILKNIPCQHPVIFLMGMKGPVIRLITSYIYAGAVDVPEDLLNDFFQSALSLEVVGLTESAKEHCKSDKQASLIKNPPSADEAVLSPAKRPRLEEPTVKDASPSLTFSSHLPLEKEQNNFRLPFAQNLNNNLTESERIENIKADLENSSLSTFSSEPSPGPSQGGAGDSDVLVLLETESLCKKTDPHIDKSPIAASSPGGQQATSPLTSSSLMQGWENETCIWQGNVAFHSKQRQLAEKVAHYVNFKVFSKVVNYQPVVDASTWPAMLHLQLVPSKLLPSILTGEVKHRGNLVKLLPTMCNDTNLLVRALKSSYVGCVYLKDTRDTPANNMEILLLTVGADKKSLVGFISNDQKMLINHLRKTFQENRDSRAMSPNTSQGQLFSSNTEATSEAIAGPTGRATLANCELLRLLLQSRQPGLVQQQPVTATVQNVTQQQQIPVGTMLASPQNVFVSPPTSVQMLQQPVVVGNPVELRPPAPQTNYISDESSLLDLLNGGDNR